MLIRSAELAGRDGVDVRIGDGRISEIGRGLSALRGERVLDAAGGALLPGLHDHHVHLFAMAAAQSSVVCGPPAVRDAEALAAALASARAEPPIGGAPHAGWIRGVGYCESVAGALDRVALDRITPDTPLRIQHRSGAMWILNSAGVARLGLDRGVDARGVERDDAGRATGRLLRLDTWLREQIESGDTTRPCFARVGRQLARFGVTGVTDATPANGRSELAAFVDAIEKGELRQRLLVMGKSSLPVSSHPEVERGAVKIWLAESDLPPFEALVETIEVAHRQRRPVAVHCVTRAELVLASAAVASAGGLAGDRIEHAAVVPPDAMALLSDLGVTVVTQPNFIFERGDRYAVEVDPRDRPWLYRGRGFLDAAVPLGGGTDAPFGNSDPWLAMRAAVDRRSAAGLELAGDEALTPERALGLFTSPAKAPGAPPRQIAVAASADLCLLDRPWSAARRSLASDQVAATLCQGRLTWLRKGS